MYVSIAPYLPVGVHNSVTVAAVRQVTTPGNSSGLLVQALTQNIRFTLDTTNPTTTVGFQIKAGDPPVLIPCGPNITVRFLEETASATLQYQAVRTLDVP